MCRPCISSVSDAHLSEVISAEYVTRIGYGEHVKLINIAGGIWLSVMATFFSVSAGLPCLYVLVVHRINQRHDVHATPRDCLHSAGGVHRQKLSGLKAASHVIRRQKRKKKVGDSTARRFLQVDSQRAKNLSSFSVVGLIIPFGLDW